MELNETIRKSVLFRGMNEDEIAEALSELHGTVKNYKRRQAVLHAGKKTDNIGLVLSGSVTIESNDMWGNRTVLNIADAGDFFAETYALLKDETVLVDVIANETTEILFLNIGNLMYSQDMNKAWQIKLTKNLLMISTRKNLILSGRSFHISPKSVRGRISAYLNSVALKKGSRYFDIPFDRQQMADYLNLDRTALSKELGRMRDEGLIDFQKNHFRILG